VTPDEIRSLSLIELRDRIAAGDLSAVEVTEATLEQAERFGESHNLFVTYTPDVARQMAAEADAARAAGKPLGPLHGVPVGVKDNIDVAGMPGTAGMLVLQDRVPAEDATVVARLRAAGAIFFGKLNMHELAMGGTSANAHFGAVRNPWNPEHHPGGSSGASAAAVALQVCPAALGTDSAGSVRIPSMACGIVGLKQTHGVVSLKGGMPTITEHTDHIGPHTRNIADARLMLEVMAGHDPDDPHSTPGALEPAAPVADLAGLTVGVPEAYFWVDVDPEIEAVCRRVVDQMAAAGATVVPLSCDITQYMAASRAASAAEAFVYHEPLLREHPERYSPDLRARLLAGQYVLAHDYIRAMRARRLVVETLRDAFAAVDVMVMPTLPITPQKIDDLPGLGLTATLPLVRNTSPFNQAGTPAVTIPVGVTEYGLPIGFQVAGRAFEDYRVLAVAEFLEGLVGFDPTPPVLTAAAATA
jgi:aspartyl-tRNA(Asn)/glutamyl-tRNA(Gln) amidotransferase subunit A